MALKLQPAPSLIDNTKRQSILSFIVMIIFAIAMLTLSFVNIDYCSGETDISVGVLNLVQAGIMIVVFSLSFLPVIYGYRALDKRSLTLNSQGIQYHSGLPAWLQFMNNKDWAMTWEEIRFIQVKKSMSYSAIGLDIYSRKQDKPFYVLPFHWVDSQTLDESHVESPLEHKVNFQLTPGFTDEQYEFILPRSPLVKHLIQRNINFQSFAKPDIYANIAKTLIVVSLLIVAISPLLMNFSDYMPFFSQQFELKPASKTYDLPEHSISVLKGHKDNIIDVATSHDGKYAVSGSIDTTVRLWDIEAGEFIKTFRGHKGKVQTVAFHPNGHLIASGARDDTVRLWNVESGELETTLQGHGANFTSYDGIYDVDFSPDGQYIASASWDGSVRIWDLDADKLHWLSPQNKNVGHQNSVDAVIFSLDGKLLASGGFDNSVRIWDVKTGEQVQVLSGHRDWVTTVAFSPDGTMLASGDYSNRIYIWQLSTGDILQTILGHHNDVIDLEFTADSQVIVSASADRTIRYWEASTGGHITTLEGHRDYVNGIALTPDNRTLVSASGDDTLRVWQRYDDIE